MHVELEECAKGAALPSTSLAFGSGEAVRIVSETEQRPTVLGLIASGRMRPSTGIMRLDGETATGAVRRDLRRRVALVDAPDVSEPDGRISLRGVLAEELLFAGIPGDPVSVRRWAAQLGFDGLERPFGELDPATRLRALTEVAILRDDVEGLVLVSPDRHGGEPGAWWSVATSLAGRGFAVVAIVGAASDDALRRDDATAATSTLEERSPSSPGASGAPAHDQERPESHETTDSPSSPIPHDPLPSALEAPQHRAQHARIEEGPGA